MLSIKIYIINPKLILLGFMKKYSILFTDRFYLKAQFRLRLGKKLNLTNPQTFNEKLQWLKLYDRKPEYTNMVDKYLAKKYVASIIGEEHIISTLGLWENFEAIDFNLLPKQFVLKTTHDQGGIVICQDKNKFDKNAARNKINNHLKKNAYYTYREWPYKNVKPRIICEEFISQTNNVPDDYKILCFHGQAKLIELHKDRFGDHKQDFYDVNWQKTTISQDYSTSKQIYEKPKPLAEMIQLSEKLAANIKHVRVDWFVVQDKIYFGEITFYDGGGMTAFDDIKDDYLLGSWININR